MGGSKLSPDTLSTIKGSVLQRTWPRGQCGCNSPGRESIGIGVATTAAEQGTGRYQDNQEALRASLESLYTPSQVPAFEDIQFVLIIILKL